MEFYFAPLEGLTDYVFRNVHHQFFPGTDKYYTPFISVYAGPSIKKRDRKDILPEYNSDVNIVPQILTKDPAQFLYAMQLTAELGYREVNLNLGCPSGTVAAKGKGAGFLREPDELERFLDAVFSAADKADISVSLKTRLGFASMEEAERLMEIYGQFPISLLIIHPRTKEQFYGGKPDLDAFEKALAKSRCPVCYNGDIKTPEDMRAFAQRFPSVESVMIGRGLVSDPALVRRILGGTECKTGELKEYTAAMAEAYLAEKGETAMLARMKELWTWLGMAIPESTRRVHDIKKANTVQAYRAAVVNLFGSCSVGERR